VESILIQESGSNRRMERYDLYVVSQLYSTPAIIMIIRTRLIDVQVWEEIRNVFKISVRKLKGKDELEHLGMDGRTVLNTP
jgi:hypothetical protein